MDIVFATRGLETLCSDETQQQRRLGPAGAKKLRSRLADILAASNVSALRAGRPHPLKGDRAGQFALDVDGGKRLVFEPANQPPPKRPDGSIAWDLVTSVRITFLGDYHD